MKTLNIKNNIRHDENLLSIVLQYVSCYNHTSNAHMEIVTSITAY